MESKTSLGVGDYIVIIIFLLVFAATGVFFRTKGKQTLTEYFLAGRNMSLFPIIFSTTSTMISTGTMLGVPTEIYRYGIQHIITPLTTGIGMIVASYVFIPVYFQCGVSTVYEFLGMRFGKLTRYFVSVMFLLQTVLISASILYGPALALSAVTDLSFRTSVFVIGGVCTFYSSVGGLKGVIWADVLQAFLMFICMIALIAAGIGDAGGVSTIYERAKIGERLDIFNTLFYKYVIDDTYPGWRIQHFKKYPL